MIWQREERETKRLFLCKGQAFQSEQTVLKDIYRILFTVLRRYHHPNGSGKSTLMKNHRRTGKVIREKQVLAGLLCGHLVQEPHLDSSEEVVMDQCRALTLWRNTKK